MLDNSLVSLILQEARLKYVFVSIPLFGLYLSAYYSFCEAQSVEEEGCSSFVTISELTTLLEGVSDLQPNNESQPNITIEDICINCLSVGSILG